MIPVIFAAVHAYYMLVSTFPYVSNESGDPLDADILLWMGMVFGPIGPIMFGILWDTSKMQTSLGVKLICLFGGIIHYVGYLFEWSRIMAIGYLFVAITAVALSSIALAKIHEDFGHNKIGNLCVYFFWVAICDLYLYVMVEVLLD